MYMTIVLSTGFGMLLRPPPGDKGLRMVMRRRSTAIPLCALSIYDRGTN